MLAILFKPAAATAPPPGPLVLRTRVSARDTVMGLFKAAWDLDPVAMLIPVFYQGVKRTPQTDDLQAYVVVSIVHLTGGQSSLPGALGTSTYRRQAVFSAQLNTVGGDGLTTSDSLVKVLQDIFEGAIAFEDIWFSNARFSEIGQDGDRFQTNFLVDFEYDEIK